MTQDLYVRSAFVGQLVVASFDFNDFLERVGEQHAEFVPTLQPGLALVSMQIQGARVKLMVSGSTPGASYLYGVRATTPANDIELQLRMLNVRAAANPPTVPTPEVLEPGSGFMHLINADGELLVTASDEALYTY